VKVNRGNGSLNRRPIYVIAKVGRDYEIQLKRRVLLTFQGQPVVRFKDRIQPVRSADRLAKFIKNKTTIFGGRKPRENPPRFRYKGREYVADDQPLPFVKVWEKKCGYYR